MYLFNRPLGTGQLYRGTRVTEGLCLQLWEITEAVCSSVAGATVVPAWQAGLREGRGGLKGAVDRNSPVHGRPALYAPPDTLLGSDRNATFPSAWGLRLLITEDGWNLTLYQRSTQSETGDEGPRTQTENSRWTVNEAQTLNSEDSVRHVC